MDDSTRKMLDLVKRQRELLGPQDAIRQHLESVSGVDQLNRHLSGFSATIHEALSNRSYLDSTQEIAREHARQMALLESSASTIQKLVANAKQHFADDQRLKTIEDAGKLLRDRFRPIELPELKLLHERLQNVLGPVSRLQDIETHLREIKSPWVSSLNALNSLEGVTSLARLGTTLRDRPYDPQTIEALRDSVGLWTALPEPAIEDSLQRDEHYVKEGLRPELIAIPGGAYPEVLQATELIPSVSPDPETLDVFIPLEEPLSPDEEAIIERTLRASQILVRFEFTLRNYIHREMSQRYGTDWEKGYTPENGKMCQRWLDKKSTALKKGEQEQDLIQYADFTDYVKIITRGDNWDNVFSSRLRDKKVTEVSFQRLEHLRIVTFHSRAVSNADLLMVGAETTHILSALGAIKKQ